MCKIRIIRKANESTIISSTIDFNNININPIDRPAYVLYVNQGENYGLNFIFSSDKEPKNKIDIANISIEYGINSGRVYFVLLKKDSINQTDTYSIVNNITDESRTERFKENIQSFISLINQTILFSKEHF